jgi:hypothetical protein
MLKNIKNIRIIFLLHFYCFKGWKLVSILRLHYWFVSLCSEHKENSGNSCYHSVQNLLSFHLLSENIKIRIYKITMLLVVLYVCETWSVTLKEEQRLGRIFGPKRDEVIGGLRKLCNKELHDLYSSPSIIRKSRRMKWTDHIVCNGEKRNACRLLV